MTNTDDLAARIRRLEDRLELRELSVRYCRAIDDTDWTAVGALFADQAELGDVTGRDQVVTALRSVRETYGRTVHMAHGLMADFADDGHATGMVPAHAELDIGGETIICHIRYYDRYVRERGRWVFGRRDLKFLYAVPWSQMALALIDELPVRWPGTPPAPADVFPQEHQ